MNTNEKFQVIAKLMSGSYEKAYGWELAKDYETFAEGVFDDPVEIAGDFDAFTALVAEASGYGLVNIAMGADFSEAYGYLAWEVEITGQPTSAEK